MFELFHLVIRRYYRNNRAKFIIFKPYFCIITVKPDITQHNSFGSEVVKVKGGATKAELEVIFNTIRILYYFI